MPENVIELVKRSVDEYLRTIIREEVQQLIDGETGVKEVSKPAIISEQPAATSLKTVSPGEMPPWVTKAYEYNGLMESDDRDVLEPFLGINPDDQAGGLPWCAAFVSKTLEECGIQSTESLTAVDYANWGQECEKKDGAIAVFGPGNIPGGHVGFIVNNGTKILGGNQGDMVRENNLAWYEQNKKLLGYKWPSEYQV